jgi:ribosomal protein S18 acetylase RimI-like enzyme
MNVHILEIDQTLKGSTEKIFSIFQKSYKIEADLIGIEDFPPLKRTPADILECQNSFWGLFLDEDIVAVIEIDANRNNGLIINSLVVHPAYFRKGYACSLIDFIISRENWSSITVETAEKNIPAINLYRKSGFKIIKKWNTKENIQINQLRIMHRVDI